MGGFGLAVACPPALAAAQLGAPQQLRSFLEAAQADFPLSHPKLNAC